MELNRRQFGRILGPAVGGLAMDGWSDAVIIATEGSYLVKKGDTLSQIARKFGSSVKELQQLNGLSSPHMIRAGQHLKVAKTAGSASSIARKLRWQIGHKHVDRKRWKKIIVHHSATRNGNAEIFHQAHLRRRMENGLAYHFVIGNGANETRNGEIEIGGRWKKQIHGGHMRSQRLNETSIGICLVGNFQVTKPTAKQLDSLYNLTQFLQSELILGHPRVYGHKDLEHNLCPGRNFPLKQYRTRFA
ncbi:MAG: N-acetylmuramoyl-L-alanine amidase XlyA [Verrucomicrobia subdivision 3 bacterium]|nr:N-acetylmuramoyl-L-alanine amidase XlyA [Limisphaerales bacterium]MCS1413519.1 N-acetylmuramoyl-L-alanine amidase XlyA [Limisphaerales bacterium]